MVKINYMVRRTGGRYQLGSFLGNSAETSYLTKTRERQMEVVLKKKEMEVVTSDQILNLFCQ